MATLHEGVLRHKAFTVYSGKWCSYVEDAMAEELRVDASALVPHLRPGILFAQEWSEECVVRTHASLEWCSRFALGILGDGAPDRSNEWKLPARKIPNTDGHVLLFEGREDCIVTLLGLGKPAFRTKLLWHIRTFEVLPTLQHTWNLNPGTASGWDIWLGEEAVLPLLCGNREWLDAIHDALGCLVLTSE